MCIPDSLYLPLASFNSCQLSDVCLLFFFLEAFLIEFPDRRTAIGTRLKCLFIRYELQDLFIYHWIHNSRITHLHLRRA